jgi:hypothetical protein
MSTGLKIAAEWVSLPLHIQAVLGLNLRPKLATQTAFMIYLKVGLDQFHILFNPLFTNHAMNA